MSVDEINPRSTGQYLRSMTASRKEIIELTFEEAAQLAEDGEPLFECIKDDVPYTAYTDCDHYCDSPEIPSDDIIDDVQERMMNNLGHLINDQFTDEHKGTFGIATRHGLDAKKQVYKLSWRCYFFGFVITPAEMKKVIVQKGLDKGGSGSLDSSPYSKNQLLGCVGFPKSKIDRRVLVPLDESMPLERFMVQNITGKEIELKYDDSEDDVQVSAPLDWSVGNFDHPRFVPPWDILEKLVMSLDVQNRCGKGTYLAWARIGWAINGVARAAKRFSDGLELWLKFCRRCIDTYLEDPMKARLIYCGAKSRDQQLGWTSLMEALREDDIGMHQQIAKQVRDIGGAEITGEDELKIIKKFVYTSFHHKPNDIGQVIVKSYDHGSFLIVNTTEDRPYCPLFEGEHEPILHPYVVIGLKTAKNKCRHHDCKDKTDIVIEFVSYPIDLKTIVARLLRKVQSPEEAISKFVRQRKATDFTMMDDHDAEIAAPEAMPLGGTRFALTKNRFCCVCQCLHDNPENCIIVNEAATKLAMACRQQPFKCHPSGGVLVPANVSNIIIQNAVINVNNVTTEAISSLLDTDFAADDLPCFSNEPDRLERFVRSISGGHNDIAWFVHALWGEEFRYFDDKWHCFEGHIWNPIKKTPLLRSRLSTGLCEYYKAAQRHYQNNLHLSKAKEKAESLKKMILSLKTAHFKDSVMKEIVEVFQIENREWAKEVNMADLLPFNNGVFDLQTFQFRDGQREDRMTLSTRIDYLPYDKEDPTSSKIKAFVKSIQPDKAARHYLLKSAALCLTRETAYQTFTVFTGSGANGKSIFTDLLGRTLGDFAITARVEILTMPAGSPHSAQSGLDVLENKRLVLFDEPPKNSVIQAEIIKRFAGGTDKISTRGLHQSEREFIPVFKPVLTCNSIPLVSEDSHAIWRRMKVVDFPVQFVDTPAVDNSLSQLADHNLSAASKTWGPRFAGYLIKWLRRLQADGLTPPTAVTAVTEEYRDDNDPYSEYCSEALERCDTELWLQWTDLLAHFRTWHDKRFPSRPLGKGKKSKDVQALRKYFERKLGDIVVTQRKKQNVNGIFGWKLQSEFVADPEQ